MTPREFRDSIAWKHARRAKMRGALYCALCGGELRRDLGPRHRLAPSVDHVIPLARIDLSTAAGRRLAVDPSVLRVAHLGCNSSRGDGTRTRQTRPPGPPRRRQGRSTSRVGSTQMVRADWW